MDTRLHGARRGVGLVLLMGCAADPPSDPAGDTPRDDTAAVTGDTGDSAVDTGDTTAVRLGGPCASYAEAVAMGTVQDPALDELSGLAPSRLNPGILWTHEDSAGAADLYALDASGVTVTTIHVEGATNVDWEDLAVGPCGETWCLTVGDIGDLGTDRSEFVLYTLEEPVLDGTPEWTIPAEIHPFTYPGEPEDAEGLALLSDGTPLVVTKRADTTARLYALPEGETVLVPLSELSTGPEGEDLPARVTAADLWLDPPTLLVRTYLHLYTFDLADPEAPADRQDLAFALELQGEAVAWDPTQGGFWQVAEGSAATLWWTGCAE